MHRSLFALLLAGTTPLFCAVPLAAQTIPAPSGDADELAAQMRQLAANPQDLSALIRAGELALRLDDPTAAAGFFARAERIDPRNARIKAGLGSLLVGEERPGEALRRFAEAEALGADARGFAADRGLAYDLIGEQDRAQRDYRTALRNGTNDETVRRYALSLGISGKREEAYAVLEPLLRRSDRGAWRSRAFILAMSGDPVGASQIATSMLPPGMAQGLQPFFDRLPSLPAADRAFAVHFGEVRATPQRLADARLVPPLAVLGPDPYAPRAVAAAAVPAPVAARSDDRRRRRKRKGEPVQVAATTPTPPPLPAPPAYVASSQADDEPLAPAASSLPPRPVYSQAIVQPLPAATIAATPARRPPVSFSAAPVRPTVVTSAATPTPAATSSQPPVALAANNIRVPLAGPPNETMVPTQDSSGDEDGPVAPVTAAQPQQVPAEVATVVPQPTTFAPPPPAAVVPRPTVIATPPPAPVVPKPTPAVTRPAATAAKPAPVRSEDSILASIIAGIKVPGSELAHTPPPPPAKPARATAVPAEKPAPGTVPAAKPGTRAADAAKAAAAAKKAAEEKRRNDPKLLEPARIWVQVAGGANEAALVMAWNTMKSRAPAAFKGRQGWTTPLRATHRVLAGPFKTDDEARAFVNTLAKSGVQAFVFTSEAGQKITKLPTK
ncbi:MAG: SPOR domain-containing protein [Pseudomonadota bacterium]